MKVPMRKGDMTREQYVLLLTPAQQEACRFVELFRQGIEQYCMERKFRSHLTVTIGDIEELFVEFARKYVLPGELYQLNASGDCPAISMVYDNRSNGKAAKMGAKTITSAPKELTFLNQCLYKERVMEVVRLVMDEFMEKRARGRAPK